MRVHRLNRVMAVAAMAATAIIVTAPAAWAHPRLLSADPKPSTVAPGPVDHITVRFDEAVQWQYSTIGVEDTKGHSLLNGKPQTANREAVLPLQPGSSGALRVSWRLVGVDAHPVIGAYVFGIGAAGGAADLDTAIRRMAGSLGEGRIGSQGLNWAIRGGRSLEIILLYVVLGLLMVRLFVLKEAPALPRGPGAATLAAVEPDRGYRMMRVLGIAAAVAMPLLFALYVARLDSAVGNVALGKVLFSSLGEEWAMKTLLWVGIAAAAVYGLRHYPTGARQHDLFLLSLAAAAAIAFGFNTHANGLSPGPVWTAMMFGHLMVTAFWAGGLVALLLVVFPTGDPHRIWPAVSRYSNIMTVTLGLIVASGLVMLFRLLSGNIKGMWCSDFGVVAGFKMAVVGIAIVIGAINNRVVAYQKRSLEAPVNKFRPRKERSIGSLRRLIVIEAAFLGSAVLLSGALGETQLPSVFKGHFFPLDLQETVRPGLFGSGCQ
ncbi:MAG TPA: copper resistance protein CopC [Acidimicrobiia bacterium]|nr:copper resistance protein CopC [Acidimicrobiia bacterium]